MRKVVTAAQMRRAEERAEAAGISTARLMHNAGAAAARVIGAAIARAGPDARVLILCGPGNNGGDGMVVARRLADREHVVTAYTFRRRESASLRPAVVRYEDDNDLVALRGELEASMLIVDALLGTGRSRPIEGQLAAILDAVRGAARTRAVVALDLPTGVDADTGAADPHALPATITITFGFPKRGLLLGPGARLAGTVVTADIGLPAGAAEDVRLWRVGEDDVRARIPLRPRDAHKYSAGAVLIVAGSRRFTGAPRLAALGAGRAGAGLVTLATGASTHPLLAIGHMEPTFLPLPEDASGDLDPGAAGHAIRAAATRYRALLIGPGLAQTESTRRLVESLLCEEGLPADLPVVVDAEGLNALSATEDWAGRARYPLVLTPHTGEMARLCGVTSSEVDRERFDLASARARDWGAVVVLKGSPTVTASPEGDTAVNSTGGPNLATGGTGDVLAGIIASLVAQGASPFDAAVAGVYLHGRAGDVLAERHGDRGTLAGDLPAELPAVIKAVREGR